MTDIIHNTDTKHFELQKDGHTAFISYQESDDTLIYEHTIVPDALGGQGIGSKLVKYALNYAREQNKKIIPQCSFVAHYINKHPEYQELVK